MPNPYGFATKRPAFSGEDLFDTITVSGSGSIQGWTLGAHLYSPLPPNAELVGAITAVVSNPLGRIISVSIVGQNFTLTGDYPFTIYRVDSGFRTLISWGVFEVVAPVQQTGWGQGMV